MVQFALDKVRPPVKPGDSHGAILKNVRVVRNALFPDKETGTDSNRCFNAAGTDHLGHTVGDIKDVIRLHLQIIYFGREYCPAKGHVPAACPICSWAMSKARANRERRQSSSKPVMLRATRRP